MKYSKRTIKNTISGVKYHFLLLMSGVLLAMSCSEMQTETPLAEQRQELTPEQSELRNKLKDTALLLKQVVAKPDALRELRYAIRFYRDEQNTDERVSFSSLLSEDAAYKTTWRKQKVADARNRTFADVFRGAINRKRKETSSSSFDMEEFLNKEGVEIYFPYSENWENQEVVPTLTYDPIDNEDINEGWKPALSAKAKTAETPTLASAETWNGVTVDDEYAFTNPTFIILPPEDDGGGGSGSNSPNTYSIQVIPDENTTAQVKLGYIRLEEQLDGLYRGGTDLRILFADVVEIEPGTIVAKEKVIKKDLTRPDVSQKRWKSISQIADYRWHKYQKTLPMYIYDHDGKANKSNISFHYQIKDEKGNFVKIESEHPISKQRDTIDQFYFDRELFLKDNKNNSDEGIKGGYQIYKANHKFYFTLPHRKIDLN